MAEQKVIIDENATVVSRFTKAAVQIITTHPFWASFVLPLVRVPTRSVDTTRTDGKYLYYNPDFILKLSKPELMFTMLHEAAHVFLGHHLRARGKDPKLWNRATDYVVNDLLVDMGFQKPKEYPLEHDPRFKWKDMAAEHVYNILFQENQDDDNKDGNDPGGDGPVGDDGIGGVEQMTKPDGDPMTDTEVSHEESELDIRRRQAASQAKRQGKLPGGLEEVIEEMGTQVADWREILSRFMGERVKNDYSWMRPNKKKLASLDVYLPSMDGETFSPVAFAIDTSGSVSYEELKQAVGEVLYALETYEEEGVDAVTLPVIYCDAQVNRVEFLESDSIPKPKGGGGTRFSPVMDWIRRNGPEHEIEALIYQTDGCCSDFGEDPGVPVLWILAGEYCVDPKHFKPPFGEVVKLGQGSK